MTAIYVQNHSSLVTDTEAMAMTRACATQVAYHAAPWWGRTPIPVIFISVDSPVPSGAWLIGIIDDADQAGDLGWHTEDQGDVVYGRVFAKPVLDNGGGVLAGSLSVSSVLSHEVLETFCVAPETRILTRDLNWMAAGDLVEGELLVGFDEESGGQGRKRRYDLSAVESARRVIKPCYELELEDGTFVTCSAQHRWLVNNGGRSHWVETQRLTSVVPAPDARGRTRGEGKTASRILKPLDVWDGVPRSRSYEEGYLAAAFDGEGCLSQHVSSSGDVQCRLTFSQNENAMLDAVQQYLKGLGIRWTESEVVREGVHHHRLYVSQKRDVLTVLGRTRPKRLLEKFQPEVLGCMLTDNLNAPRVMTKRFVGDREVVALRTTSRTYVAEGLASHNCDPHVNMWAQASDGTMWACEVGDPVESDSYPVDGVMVSNFVTPHWFDAQNANQRMDWLGRTTGPFKMSRGGYAVIMTPGSAPKQVFGDEYPEWKKATKMIGVARSAKRLVPKAT